MAATAAAARPALGLLPPYLSRLSSACCCTPSPSTPYFSPVGCPSFPVVRWRRAFHSVRIVPCSSVPLLSTHAVDASSVLSQSLSLGKKSLLSGAFGQLQSSCARENLFRVAKLSSSGFLPRNALLSGVAVEAGDHGSSPVGFEIVPPTVLESAESDLPAPAEPQHAAVSSSSSRKKTRMCYYHSQGLCTMTEDPEHLAKYSHEFSDLSVREEDLKKVRAQPFDYFLVLDLEGMVEILEFPVMMIDAKTLQVVDHFHRFVRPAKMSKERIDDYIRNKYGRWRLERVWHDTATPFTDVLQAFEGWLEGHGLWDPKSNGKLTTAAFVTCGNWDVKTKIPEQCVTSEIELPAYFNEWINLKDVYFNFYKFRASGMLAMMKGLKMQMVGTHHVGLDDTQNIARILQRMLAHGVLIQITAKRKLGDPKAVKFTFRFRIK